MSRLPKRKPLILVILDGWGLSPVREGNAIAKAKTPEMHRLWASYPHAELSASGKAVGLPPHQIGNSEAGHMNIGAGRVIEQDAVRIGRSINEGTFFKNPAFVAAVEHVKKYKSHLHLMGMLTAEQSAHADPDHLLALITFFRLSGIKNVFLHLFTDGRDSYQYLAPQLLEKLQKTFLNGEKIATIIGRYYAMDRNKEWDRTAKAYNALVLGKGRHARNAIEAVLQAYNRHENDEYIEPTVISLNNGGPYHDRINNNDALVFFNLRSDRVRELTKAFIQPEFAGLAREKILKNLCFVSLTDFGPDLPGILAAYPARYISNTLPFALKNIRQCYVAETEKNAHMTYFFNGGYDHPVVGEERIIIKSPRVYSFKDKPAMSAKKITATVVRALLNNKYDFIAVNFANPDMVAHTGDMRASIKAVEVVDACLVKLERTILACEGTMIVTADHGNIEEVKDVKTGQVNTSHSSNPVPFIVINDKISKRSKLKNGVLGDIAPTILHMLRLPKPKEMSNKILCQYQISR